MRLVSYRAAPPRFVMVTEFKTTTAFFANEVSVVKRTSHHQVWSRTGRAWRPDQSRSDNANYNYPSRGCQLERLLPG